MNGFRDWIISQLVARHPALRPRPGESLTALAKRLGVQLSVLEEARAKAAKEVFTTKGKDRFYKHHAIYTLQVPEAMYADLRRLCSRLGLKRDTLMRSVMDAGLRATHIPRVKPFLYRGVAAPCAATRVRFRATFGADTALADLCERIRVKRKSTMPKALWIRGCLRDYLEGRLVMEVVRKPADMPDEASEYTRLFTI